METQAEKIISTNGNMMAGDRPICPTLLKYYKEGDIQAKLDQVNTPEAVFLFNGLPRDVSMMLLGGFLTGAFAEQVPSWQEVVVDYFQNNSRIIPALTANPGTYTMLEKMYHFEPVEGVIDNYFLQSIAGGQALKNRYEAVTAQACKHVLEILQTTGSCYMIDLGSGPGRNGIDICRQHPEFNGNIKIDCVDIDPEAIVFGTKLVKEKNIKQVEFIPTSMTRLHKRYPGTVDYGIIIGVLCGLTRAERIGLLSIIRPYFKSGARLVAASLLETMAQKDLLCAYILRETTGWGLQYPPLGELKEVFEAAGWIYEGFFHEEPTRLYEIGIGVAP